MEANLIRERREAKKAKTTMTCSWMITVYMAVKLFLVNFQNQKNAMMCTDPLDVLGLRYGLFLLVQDNVLTCYANEVWFYDMSTCECMLQPFSVSTAGSIWGQSRI